MAENPSRHSLRQRAKRRRGSTTFLYLLFFFLLFFFVSTLVSLYLRARAHTRKTQRSLRMLNAPPEDSPREELRVRDFGHIPLRLAPPPGPPHSGYPTAICKRGSCLDTLASSRIVRDKKIPNFFFSIYQRNDSFNLIFSSVHGENKETQSVRVLFRRLRDGRRLRETVEQVSPRLLVKP